MSVSAFILVSAAPDKTVPVLAALKKIPNSMVWEVLGPHDFIVGVDRTDFDALSTDVRAYVRGIPGVTNTTTCVVMSGPARAGPVIHSRPRLQVVRRYRRGAAAPAGQL